MKMLHLHHLMLTVWAMACVQLLFGQATIGTLNLTSEANQDYVLFSPNVSESTYLIDKCGRLIHQWETEGRPGMMAYFMDNGDLLRTRVHQTGQFIGGGIGGIIERFDWDGNLVWNDTIATFSHHHHHDIAVLPNGNILAILWEKWFAEDAIARGQLPELASEEVWVTRIVELLPLTGSGSEVVWSWSPWEHLIQDTDAALPHYGDPADYPQRFDVNFQAISESGGAGLGQEATFDWMHVNSIHYHAERDEIILSSRHWNEVWIVDHSTTNEEAAGSSGGQHGRGGDLLWRWGNPAAYGQGSNTDQVFFGQHDAQFITDSEGVTISVYNNGLDRPDGNYSTVHHIEVPLDATGGYPIPSNGAFEPESAAWTYPASPDYDFFSHNVSGYTRLTDGHHLICQGAKGRFFELDNNGSMVWEYINPITSTGPATQGNPPIQSAVFRALAVPPSHPGLQGRNLDPGLPLELDPLPLDCTVDVGEITTDEAIRVWPNPASKSWTISNLDLQMPTQIVIYDAQGSLHWSGSATRETTIDIEFWSPGLYIAILHNANPLRNTQTPTTLKLLVQ